MTLFHVHPGESISSRGARHTSRLSVVRTRRGFALALKAMHRAIVAAKLRRLRNELMYRNTPAPAAELDAAKFPQRPLILGDKWDF